MSGRIPSVSCLISISNRCISFVSGIAMFRQLICPSPSIHEMTESKKQVDPQLTHERRYQARQLVRT
jgi:hypothetical protein